MRTALTIGSATLLVVASGVLIQAPIASLNPAWGLGGIVIVIVASLLVLLVGLRATGREPERRAARDPRAV